MRKSNRNIMMYEKRGPEMVDTHCTIHVDDKAWLQEVADNWPDGPRAIGRVGGDWLTEIIREKRRATWRVKRQKNLRKGK